MSSVARDRWAEWLAERRFGGNPEARAQMLAKLARTRDMVLDRAELRADETLLDVGCGEGLIGFGALERGAGTVIFSDISTDLLDFDERDLLQLAEDAGFSPIRLTLDARIEPIEPRGWDAFLDTAWNPNVPTLREAMEQALSPGERERLAEQLRPLVERGEGEARWACAHLSGSRP